MANDYSLDPFELEEQELRERQARAQAASLRLSGNPIIDAALVSGDRVKSAFDQADISRRRKDLGERSAAAMSASLRGVDPEIASMVQNPATRTQGLALLQKAKQQKMDEEEMKRLMGETGASGNDQPGPGGLPPYKVAAAMSLHSNPTISGRGKQALELYKGQDPKNNVRLDASGNMVPIPGGAEQYVSQQREIAQGRQDASNPAGTPIKQYDQYGNESTGYANPPGGRALPGANPQGFAPAGPPGGSSVPGPSNGPASGPIPPANDLSGSPPPGALPGATDAISKVAMINRSYGPGNMQVSPQEQATRDGGRLQLLMQEAQKIAAVLNDPRMPPDAKQEAQRELMAVENEIRSTQARGGRPSAPQSAPPQALPEAAAASGGVPRPTPGRPDPGGTALYSEANKTSEDIYKDTQIKSYRSSKSLDLLNRIEELNKQPTFSGRAGPFLNEASQWAGSLVGAPASDRAVNTDTLNANIQTGVSTILKEYGSGNGITERDVRTAGERWPNVAQDPRARQAILNDLKQIIQRDYRVNQQVSQIMQQSRGTPHEIQDPVALHERLYIEDMQREAAERERTTNPTPAGGARALPGATSTGLPRNMPGSSGTGGPSVAGFLQDQPMTDLSNSVKSLPGALANMDAAWDAGMNMGEGVRQAVGLGNYPEWSRVKDEQDKRRASDPEYSQGRTFYDIFKPTNMIPGGGSVLGTAASAATSAFLEPAKSYGEKFDNAIPAAVLGTAAGTASKALTPTTLMSKALNREGAADDLLKQFPSFKPTSPQMNPRKVDSVVGKTFGVNDAAYLKQAQAITKDLMTNAGIPGQQLTTKNIARGEINLGQDFTKWAKKIGKVPMDSTEAGTLAANLKSVAGENTTYLRPLVDILENTKTRGLSAEALQKAWVEVGETGAPKAVQDAARTVIEKQLAKAAPDMSAFRDLTQRSRAIQDIKRVWKGGGNEGTGESSGFLSPSKIVAEADAGPWSSTHMDAAARLINKFNVRNYRELAPEGFLSGTSDAVRTATGAVGNFFDMTGARASPLAKHFAEGLRAGVSRAPQMIYNEQLGDQ